MTGTQLPRQGSPKKQDSPKKKGFPFAKIFGGVVIAGLVIVLATMGALAVAYTQVEVPDPNADFQTNNTQVLYADGKTAMGHFQIQNRQSISFNEIPQSMKDAAIAAENRTFWTDPGISIPGMARAAYTIATGGDLQGGSTITQQYIKILYLTPERTLDRKFTELLLAAKMGREVPKDQILGGYLNTIYFGRGAYGVQAAAQAYFGVDAKDLTVEQSATLAGILNSPGRNDPAEGEGNAENLLQRYRYVLGGMAEIGAITPPEAQRMSRQLPRLAKLEQNSRMGGPGGFLLKMVQDELAGRGFSDAQIQGGGLTITTTIDKASQDAIVTSAERARSEAARNNPDDQSGKKLHPAMASVDNRTGGVRALYGGPDYVKNQRNWATTPRPTGSTFKAFALAAALKDGQRLTDTYEGDAYQPEGAPKPVRNQGGASYGPVTMLQATADSVNTAFVDMTMRMDPNGPQKVIDAAERAGVPNSGGQDWAAVPVIALGVAEASPLNMAGAYATFGNGGIQRAPHIVSKVTDADGRVLFESTSQQGKRAVEEDVNRDVTYALSRVVDDGSGRSVASLNRPTAGKTGTNGIRRTVDGQERNDVTSSWFVAYTKQVSTAVMFVAGDDGNGDLDPYADYGDSTFFGGSYPAKAWKDYMEVASQDMPIEDFPDPAYVSKQKKDGPAPRRPQPSSRSSADTNDKAAGNSGHDSNGRNASPSASAESRRGTGSDRGSGRNSADRDSSTTGPGNRGSGDRSSDSRNSGNRDPGNRNSGNRDSGNRNSGDRDSGDRDPGSRGGGGDRSPQNSERDSGGGEGTINRQSGPGSSGSRSDSGNNSASSN